MPMGYRRAVGRVGARNVHALEQADDYRKPTETGMSRLALSDADKAARDWFVQTTKELGAGDAKPCLGEAPSSGS